MIVRRIDDETLLDLIARFPSGRHPNIHAALHELAERRELDAQPKAVPVEAIKELLAVANFEVSHARAHGNDGWADTTERHAEAVDRWLAQVEGE